MTASWADLFDRAESYGADLESVRAADERSSEAGTDAEADDG